MPETNEPLKEIMYVAIPESVHTEFEGFEIDPDIMIPVEVVNGDPGWTMEHLSWEMIIAAMLKVLVYDTGNSHREYYHRFVLAAKPDIVDELSAAGIEQAKSRNFGPAEELFAALRVLVPEDPAPSLNLALVYEERAKAYQQSGQADLSETYAEQGFQLYTELVELFPDDPTVRFNAGHFLLQLKNFDRARTHFERFLEISSDKKRREIVTLVLEELDTRREADELFKQAYDFIKLGREAEAIERIERFLSRQPKVWNAWFLLGWAHRRKEEYEAARSAFERVIELGGEQTDALNELAICQMELGDYEESERTLAKALDSDPENVKIISNLGVLAMKRGEPDEAKQLFRTVLEFDENDPIATHYLDYLRES